ncbi:MAG TPA: hypothetical protein VHS30_30370 [Streptosporangiaceae bacterium]|nr:hypothetical protein [Streptosporangiaceae bacterium]
MTDKAPATAAHVTLGELVQWQKRETIGFGCDPLEPGLADRPGETRLVAVMVTSCPQEAAP